MLDVGWTELVVIAIVMIIVVGPKDLPPMLRTFGKMMTKMRGMASDFRQQFDEALKEADLDDVRKTLSDAQKLNPAHSIREAMNPLRQMGNDIKADLQKAASTDTAPKPPIPDAAVAPEVSAASVLPQDQPDLTLSYAPASAAAPDLQKPLMTEKPKVKRVAKPKAEAGLDAKRAPPRKRATAKSVEPDLSTVEKPAVSPTTGQDDA